MRHLHHDHAKHDGHHGREKLQPDALAALRLRGHLDPRRPGGRRDPRRPVVGEAAVVRGGEMGIRWLRLAHLKHVGADLQDCPEREVALPGRPLAVDQQRDSVGAGVQRLHERGHAGAVRADRQPRRVGGQADAGQPDVAVRRRADGHGAVAEPVDDPRGGPADEPDLDDPGRLSPGGRARRPAVERDDRAVAQRARGGRPRIGLAAVEPQRLPVLGPPRGVTEPSLTAGSPEPCLAMEMTGASRCAGAAPCSAPITEPSAVATSPTVASSSPLTSTSCGPCGVSAVSVTRMKPSALSPNPRKRGQAYRQRGLYFC